MKRKKADDYLNTGMVSGLKHSGHGKAGLRVVSDEKPEEDAALAEPGLEDVYLYYFRGRAEIRGGKSDGHF